MAFEINDLKGIIILVLLANPMVASTNINCSGRAFHCVNSTHFMICVDLGGGISSTIDDFVIPCPATTVCHENNIFECDFPEVTTPPLPVISVNKQSDTSEPTSVTTSVNTPTPKSDLFSVFKENITATTLPIAEDVTPVVKVEVLENIMNRVGVYSDNTTESSVTSSFIESTNDFVNDKQTSNIIITTSATDNNKNLKPAVITSINEVVTTSSTDKSTSTDTVTSVIGLINLISTDPPSVVRTKPSSNVLTSLDSSNDNIATTTEQYSTKEVKIHSENVENFTDKLNISTDIFSEKSIITDEVSTTLLLDTLTLNDINHETKNQTSDNQTIAIQNSFGKGNNTNKLVPETIKEYVTPIKIVNISKPITVDLIPQTTTDNTLVSLGLTDLISAEPKQNMPSTNNYIDTFYGGTATSTTNQFNNKIETTLSEKPVIAEIISTTPIANTVLQNVLKNDKNNDSTGEIVTVEKVTETNANSFDLEPMTVASTQTSITKTFVSITTDATMETTATFEVLFNNDSSVEKQTIVNQPLKIIITTDSPIVVTDNVYQINGELNQTLISTENISVDSTERINTVYHAPVTDINNNKITEPILVLPSSMKNPAIEITTVETLQNGFTAPAIEVTNDSSAINIASNANESVMKNVKDKILLYNTTNIMNITETVRTLVNVSSSDIMNETEPTTIKYPTIEVSTVETLNNEFTKHAIEDKTELRKTISSINASESNSETVESNAPLSIYTSPAPYNLTSVPVTNTTVKDLTSQSGIVTNPLTDFITEIITRKSSVGHTSMDYATTQQSVTDPVNKINSPLNKLKNVEKVMLPENLNADQITKTIQDEVAMTTTYWNNIENSATTLFPSDFTENTKIKDIVRSGNHGKISATSLVNTPDVLPKIIRPPTPPSNHYVTEHSSTTPETMQTTPSLDSMKILDQASSNTPKIIDIYRVSTTDYKIETSSSFPVETHNTDVEDITFIPTTILPQQELLNQENNTVHQINKITTVPKTVSSLILPTVTNAVLETKNIDSVNTEKIISKFYSNIDINKTETLSPTNGKDSVDATKLASSKKTNKDESIKIISVLNIVNSEGNAMPIEKLQTTSSNPLLSNDYIKTSESQTSSAYVTATDKVPDYNSVYVGESVTQKNPEVIVSFAHTNSHSVFSTPSMHSFSETGINTQKVQYISSETPILSNVDFQHINPTKLNKLPKVQAETLTSSVSSVPGMVVTPNGLTTVPVNNDATTILDSAFILGSTQMTSKIVTDIKMSTEPSLLTSKVVDRQIVKYTTESSLPISELPVAQTTTVLTHTTNVFDQTTEPTQITKLAQTTLLTTTGETSPSVFGIQTTDLPQYVTSTVKPNIPQSMPSLTTKEATASQRTTEPIQTKIFAQTTPFDTTNQNVQPRVKTTDLPQYVLSTVSKNIPQPMPLPPIIEVIAAQRTTEPTQTTKFSQTTLLAATGERSQSVLGIHTTDLPQYVTSTVKQNIPQLIPPLPTKEAIASQRTTEPTQTTIFAQTTPFDTTNQNVQPRVKTTDLPQYVLSTVSKNIPQPMPLPPIIEVIAAQRTTEPPQTTKFAQTTLLAATSETSQNVLRTQTTDLPQYVTSTVKQNIPQSMPSLPTVDATASQRTTEPTQTTIFAQSTPFEYTNQNIQPVLKTTALPKYVTSLLNNNIPQLMPSLPVVEVSFDQISTEKPHISRIFSETMPLATTTKTNQDILPVIRITDLPNYVTTTVTYNNPQSITDITTETISDSLTVPNSMVETIKVVGDEVSETYLRETILSDIIPTIATVNNANGIKSVKNIIDHENIIVETTSKNYEQHMPLTSGKSVDINKAEIVNHTEINWMTSNVNINSDKIKESFIEEEDLKSSVLKSSTDVMNKTLVSDSAIISKNQPKAVIPANKMEYRFTTVAINSKQAKSGALNNVTQSNTIITKENKNIVQVDSKNISDSYSINITKTNITTHHTLLLQNSTINDELEQHLVSTNHTITAEVQSHLNENDKQSNKMIHELTFNVTSMHNLNLASTKLNASSKDTSSTKVPALVFSCSNLTRGKYADKKDCRIFYTCIGNLQPMLGTCPNNTVFSEINKQCTRNLSHCVRNNQFHCLFEGRFSDFFKDNIYYICVKNRISGFIRYKLQCQDNYHLNKDMVRCEKNEEISTQSVSSVSETINDESKPTFKSEKNVSSDDFECEKEGKFPYAKDCSKFYECTKVKDVYRRKIKKCASDEVFDKKKKICVESDSGEC